MGVGELIGKLFGAGEARDDLPLRAYGKLPMYAEYRRLELSPGVPTAFSQWMDAGRLAWVRSPTRSEAGVTRPTRLLLRLPETKELVVASVWDSRDSLGRVFPFAFFVVCATEALGRDALEQWVAALSIQRTFDRFHGELMSIGRGGDFYRLYQKRTVSLRGDDLSGRLQTLRADAGRIAADAWFKALGLDQAVEAAAWFAGLLRRAERWRAQPALLAELAVSLPLAAGFSFSAQAVLWLEWLSPLLAKAGKRPWLVVPAEDPKSATAMHIIVRDPLPDDFQLLTSDDRRYRYVEHAAELAQSESGAALPVDPPDGSLAGWLQRHVPQPA